MSIADDHESTVTPNVDICMSEIASILSHYVLNLTKSSTNLSPSKVISPDLIDITPIEISLFARSVLFKNESQYQLVCWPTNPLAPGMRIAWSSLYQAGNVDIEAELMPYFLNEDDAFDWHNSVRSACMKLGIDYTTAKYSADLAFRSHDYVSHRGIGGMKSSSIVVPSNISFIQHIIVPLWSTYLTMLIRHRDAHEIAIEKNSEAGSPYDVPPTPPTNLLKDELHWVGYRQGLLALALSSQLKFPMACLPPNSEFPMWQGGSVPSLNETPRRARSMATAMHTPRFKYIETLFVQALRGVSVPRPPVWLHRQAGRYLPEYREVKGTKNFLELTGDPKLATEITMQPVRRYNVDCAIIFSDIMTIPQALGMDLLMQPGPVFPNPIRTLDDIERLVYDPKKLEHVYDALKLTRAELSSDKALVGFCGAPWTLMAYMIGKDIAKKWLHIHPRWSHLLLQKCTQVAIDYLCKQIDAGADVVQVFESNAVDLGPFDFYEYSFPYLKEIAIGVKANYPHVPMTVFPRGANYATKTISDRTLYDAISVDWAAIPAEQRAAVGPWMTLQGNLEPDVMYEPIDQIRKKVRAMINTFGKHRYIVNLGHGTKPDMSVDAVEAFVDEAQTILLGTRKSPLAMAQVDIVQHALERAHAHPFSKHTNQAWAPPPIHRYQPKGVSTKGDKILDVALAKIGDKGLFTKELEISLLNGHVALVQHSLKDLETTMIKQLVLGAVMEREDKRDAILSLKINKYTIQTLPKGAVVGTSSLRRQAQLKSMRPDLVLQDVRGNLNTRLVKLSDPSLGYDALILAVAGLVRMAKHTEILSQFHIEYLDSAVIVPAVSQGAIGIQVRRMDTGVQRLVSKIEHYETRLVCDEERTLMRDIEGGCQVPVAVDAYVNAQGQVCVHGHVWSVNGLVHVDACGNSGLQVAQLLIERGASSILQAIRSNSV